MAFTSFLTDFYQESPVLTVLGLLLFLAIVFIAALEVSVTFSLRHIPGPRAWPLIGHIPYLLKEPWRVFYEFSNKYGIVYVIRLWFKPMLVVSDPELVKIMFREREKLYLKDQWSYEFFRDVLGWGLVTSEGAAWESARKMMMPAFDYRALERLQRIFDSATDRLMDGISGAVKSSVSQTTSSDFKRSDVAILSTGDGRAIMELSSAFRQVTLEVISEVVLGLNPRDASAFPHLFEAVLDELNERPFQPWRAFLPWIEKPHRDNVNRLNDIVYAVIKQRRQLRNNDSEEQQIALKALSSKDHASLELSGEGAGISLSGKVIFENGCDMLDMMLDSGIPLSDSQLLDQVKTQLLAGHETSSMMMTWATYLLAKHPEAMAKAVAEVDSVLGLAPGVQTSTVDGAKHVEHPHFQSFRALTYLEWVLKEAMRLYAPVPVLNRELQEDDELGGYHIPKHSKIVVSIWSIHMNESIWGPDVNQFRPERFCKEETATRHSWSFLPFSIGVRSCIGQNLAYTEAKTVLGSLLREYTISLPADFKEPTTDCYVMPLRPAERLNVVLTPRRRSSA